MIEKGHDRDTLQCRIKVKELRTAYYKVQETNRRSGAAPTSCRCYKELDTILGGDPPPLQRPLWILRWLACQSRVDRTRRRQYWMKSGRGTQRRRMTRRPEINAVRSSFLPWRSLAKHSSRILAKCKQERRPLLAHFRQRKTKGDNTQSQKKAAKRKDSSDYMQNIPKEECVIVAQDSDVLTDLNISVESKTEETETRSENKQKTGVPSDCAASLGLDKKGRLGQCVASRCGSPPPPGRSSPGRAPLRIGITET
ncbi:uncharacterized protein LOC127030068 [Gopherus flavomarginatus]|uniref:uncharacterized protein LOC127030068 n=1 Tax=Gopherus flavomarginatus TaxID=286002 RepID=UPI0021CBB466|nr:uncharacterized protein LOC127030068 [Gopherus flavomarginatus]